jgi:hypothetical protein
LDYDAMRGELDEQVLSVWPVAGALMRVLESTPVIEETVGQLYNRLTDEYRKGEERWARDWPQTVKAFATELRRYAPALRRVGVDVQWDKKRKKNGQPVRVAWVRQEPALRAG